MGLIASASPGNLLALWCLRLRSGARVRVLTRSSGAGKHIEVWETICKTHRPTDCGKEETASWWAWWAESDAQRGRKWEWIGMKGWMIGIAGRDAGCFGGNRKVKEPGLPGGKICTEGGGGAPLVDVS